VRIGWPDQFIEHGSLPILREKYGLTAAAATSAILRQLRERESSGGKGLLVATPTRPALA
jgi:1-deoxy-D-xylulose-5-phosphate synthase